MRLEDVTPLEVKDIRIEQFFLDKSNPIVVQIRHYTQGEKMRMLQIIAERQKININDSKIEVSEMDLSVLEELMYMEIEYGVVKKTCPFERWNKEFIKELDAVNPKLIEHIHVKVREINGPLAGENG